jgi:hypothetical protein
MVRMQNFRILGKAAFPSLRFCAQSAIAFCCTTSDAFTEYTSITNAWEAAMVREWILRNLPEGRTSTVLHGDLLPQNLLFAIPDDRDIAVVDWECAQIGDAAYDLAIVTRGVRRPFGVANGLQRLVLFYNEAAEQKISPSAVVVHELLLHLHWLAESQTENRPGGHGPEHYSNLLGSILRRALALDANKSQTEGERIGQKAIREEFEQRNSNGT